MPISSKISGTWDTMDSAHAKVSGSWKTISNGYSKVSGEWKEFYSAFSNAPLDILVTAGGYNSTGSSSTPADAGSGGGVSKSIGQHFLSLGYRLSVEVGGANTQSRIRSLNGQASNTGGTLISVLAASNFSKTVYTENDIATEYPRGSASTVSTSYTYSGYLSPGNTLLTRSASIQFSSGPTIPSAGAGGSGGSYSLFWSTTITSCGSGPLFNRCGRRGIRSTSGSQSGGVGQASFSGDVVANGGSGMFYNSYTTVNTWTDSTLSGVTFGQYVGTPVNGAANSGNGGRGTNLPSGNSSGNGGSGRVEIRYPDTYPVLSNPGTGVLTTANGFHTYRFNSTTSITV